MLPCVVSQQDAENDAGNDILEREAQVTDGVPPDVRGIEDGSAMPSSARVIGPKVMKLAATRSVVKTWKASTGRRRRGRMRRGRRACRGLAPSAAR